MTQQGASRKIQTEEHSKRTAALVAAGSQRHKKAGRAAGTPWSKRELRDVTTAATHRPLYILK